MNYTKGEWKIERGIVIASVEGLRITNGLPDKKDVIAHIYPWAEANAQLIAQAPRMAELLKWMVTNGWNAGVSEGAKEILDSLEEK